MYFKRQCKFENFVTQLTSNQENSSTLGNFIGGEFWQEDEKDKNNENAPSQEINGIDSRFTYTREGLMIYDVHSSIKLEKKTLENKGISQQEYNVFQNYQPAHWIDSEEKHEWYHKFKSYSNALAPFAGLEFATEHGS